MPFSAVKIIGLILVLSVSSCGRETIPIQEDPAEDETTIYEHSWKAWLDLKEENGDAYTYTATETSWTGAGSRTTIEVRNGELISKKYEAYVISDETGEKTITETFEETGSAVGKDERGARPLTVDQLYELCLSQYIAVDEEENTIYFETFDNGIVSVCGYVPKDCVDDCFQGFTLSDFSWL